MNAAAGPKISLLMPSLDREFVVEAVDSVLAQSYQNWELLILGNGEERAYVRDPRISYRTNNQTGPQNKLNTLMGLASGDVFNFAADDDKLEPGALATVADRIGGAPWLAGRIVTSDGVESGRVCTYGEMLESNRIPCPAVYWTKLAARAVGCFDVTLASDYDYWLRLWEAFGPPVFVNARLAWYRIHPDQESETRTAEVIADADAVRRRHANMLTPNCDVVPGWGNKFEAANDRARQQNGGRCENGHARGQRGCVLCEDLL